MTKAQKRFLLSATILLVATFIVSNLFFFTFFETFDFSERIYNNTSIVFVWLVTCTFHYWLMKTVTDKPKAFNRVFMMQTTFKLMLYAIFVAVTLIFIEKQDAVPFVVHFFSVYLVFAIFEVSLIMKFVKDNPGQKSG
jgi:NO-binding membrane sensor protein with MHYT domain